MSTGLKVFLIGCISIVVISVLALGVGGYLFKNWWTEKRKTIENVIGTEDSEYGKKVAELNSKYPFTPPADNIVREDRLQRFLAVRKDMSVVYQQHEAEIKKMIDKPNPSAGDALQSLVVVNDLRLAQIKGLQTQNMSKDEYTYLTQMVYVNWLAMMVDQILQGQNSANSTLEGIKRSIEQVDQQLQTPNLSEEQRQQLQLTKESLEKQLQMTQEQLAALEKGMQDVPKENIELFKKYDQEIRRYGMSGLEILGI